VLIASHIEEAEQRSTKRGKKRMKLGAPFQKIALGALAISSSLLAGGSATAHAQTKNTTKPNIVIIWGDDIGQSDISAYSMGLMGFHTPNIDRIAKEGIIFTDTTPSRAARLAGRRSSPANRDCALA
jgi:hypothetical protein